ncbi:MAG TPA: hypothetical protein VIF39_05090, partial [Hyphomicrobium sp.]
YPPTSKCAASPTIFAIFFFSGALACLVRRELVIRGAVLIPLCALFIGLAKTPFAEVSAALFLGYSALWAATKTFGPLRAACNRIDASLGIYIFAGPTQQGLLWLVPGVTHVWLSFLAFAIDLPIALLSWTVIEKPALSLRAVLARRSKKHRPPVALPAA